MLNSSLRAICSEKLQRMDRMTDYFRQDNTEGFTENEIDEMNADMQSLIDENGVDPDDEQAIKGFGDVVFNRHC